jgi:methylase of polypeptide subunit release factors
MKLTQKAHEIVAEHLQSGDLTIDATAGNGYDTSFLANCVGPTGHVYAFDIQLEAIKSTKARLENLQLLDRVSVIQKSHAEMQKVFNEVHIGKIQVAMFNLGYLPNGDHSITTSAQSSIDALEILVGKNNPSALLVQNGIISLLVYPGHSEGALESIALEKWIENNPNISVNRYESITPTGPRLLILELNTYQKTSK